MRYGNLLIEGKVTTHSTTATATNADDLLFELGSATDGLGGSISFKPGAGVDAASAGSVNIADGLTLKFMDADSSNHVGFKAASTLTSNTVWTLPTADGSSDQFLRTDGAGQLSWASFPSTFLTLSDGSNTASADVSNDTIVFTGSVGIEVVVSDDPETVTFSITQTGLSSKATPIGADTFLMFDSAAANAPVYVSVTNLLNSLDIVSGVTGTGLIVKTGNDTYASRTIEASTAAGEEGIAISNGDGVAGNPAVGLDIASLTAGTVGTGTKIATFDGTNNVTVTPAQVVGSRIVRGTFTSGGIFAINHSLNVSSVLVQIFDEAGQMVLPDSLTLTDANTTGVDLTSYGTITGTWSYIVFG